MRFLFYLLPGIFMATGGSMMIGGITQIRLAQASATWPTTVGTIIVSEVKTSSNYKGKIYSPLGSFLSRLMEKSGRELTKSEVRSQKSEVVFETEIYAPLQKLCALKGGVLDPTIFDKVFLGRGNISSSNYKYASKVVNKYPVKTIVNVSHNPSKPNIAMIEAGVTKKNVYYLYIW